MEERIYHTRKAAIAACKELRLQGYKANVYVSSYGWLVSDECVAILRQIF